VFERAEALGEAIRVLINVLPATVFWRKFVEWLLGPLGAARLFLRPHNLGFCDSSLLDPATFSFFPNRMTPSAFLSARVK